MTMRELEQWIDALRLKVPPDAEVRMAFNIDDVDVIDREIRDVTVKDGAVVLEG